MIGPDAGRAWFGTALFLIMVSVGLMLVLPPDSAGFVVSTLSLIVGLLLLAALVIVIRRSKK